MNAVTLVLLVNVVSKSLQVMVKFAQNLESTVQLVVGLGFHNRVACKIVFQPIHTDTGAPLHDELVIAVQEEPNLHPEFYQRDVTD